MRYHRPEIMRCNNMRKEAPYLILFYNSSIYNVTSLMKPLLYTYMNIKDR